MNFYGVDFQRQKHKNVGEKEKLHNHFQSKIWGLQMSEITEA